VFFEHVEMILYYHKHYVIPNMRCVRIKLKESLITTAQTRNKAKK